jgi:hypothetical protein
LWLANNEPDNALHRFGIGTVRRPARPSLIAVSTRSRVSSFDLRPN